jgi:branched-chain amino acid transport system ATP-binding protein
MQIKVHHVQIHSRVGDMMQNAVLRATSSPANEDFVLVADGLSKTFDGFAAVNNVTLRVRKHSVHALIGPNGAGKTTCFNLLTKFLQPTAGSIWYRGQDITRETPENIANKGLVRSFQISAIFPRMSVRDNVKVALQRRLGISAHFWKPISTLSTLDSDADRLLDAVGLRDKAAEVAGRLSYGRKRALELATTLALEPDTLLLDEPMAGLGAEDIEMVTHLIQQVAAGRTVLMVEHNLSVVAQLADTITVLCRGEVLAEGSYEAVSKNPAVIAAYMGGGAHA